MENRLKMNISSMFMYLTILILFIPNQGSFLRMQGGGTLLLLSCFGFLVCTMKIKRIRIPRYFWFYLIIAVACRLIHFRDYGMKVHVIAILEIIGLIYMIQVSVKSQQSLERLIDNILLLFAVYSILGIVESLSGINLFDLAVGYEPPGIAQGMRFGLQRSHGMCGSSINNGMLLCLILCLCTYKLINENSRKYLYIYLLLFANAFLTLSRGVWLDVALSQTFIFLALSSKKKIYALVKALAFLLVAIIALSVISPSAVASVSTIFSEMIQSIIDTLTGVENSTLGNEGNRIELWGWVWLTVQSNPWFGLGYRAKFAYITSYGYIKESIEVMWLYMLFRSGLFGLFGYIVFQIGTIKYTVKRAFGAEKRNKKIGLNYIMFITSITYFLTQFSCSASEDLRFYFVLLGILFLHNVFMDIELSEELL